MYSRNIPRISQLRHWLAAGSPELFAILLTAHHTLNMDVTTIDVCYYNKMHARHVSLIDFIKFIHKSHLRERNFYRTLLSSALLLT